MTGTEGFRAVVLADPGRAMGKSWLRAAPGAQSAVGLSRAVAALNFERGLRRRVPSPACFSDQGFLCKSVVYLGIPALVSQRKIHHTTQKDVGLSSDVASRDLKRGLRSCISCPESFFGCVLYAQNTLPWGTVPFCVCSVHLATSVFVPATGLQMQFLHACVHMKILLHNKDSM